MQKRGLAPHVLAESPEPPATVFVSRIYGTQPMSSFRASPSIIDLGPDVHKDSVTIAVLPADAKARTSIDQYPNDFAKPRRVLERHAKDGEIGACYEASGGLHVAARAARVGYLCDIIAPSLIPTKPCVLRKRDQPCVAETCQRPSRLMNESVTERAGRMPCPGRHGP